MPTTRTTTPNLESLTHHLAKIEKQLIRHNSFALSFVRGLLTGLGASVGVTFVLALVVYVLTLIARALGIESVVQNLLQPLSGP